VVGLLLYDERNLSAGRDGFSRTAKNAALCYIDAPEFLTMLMASILLLISIVSVPWRSSHAL
jgi:hypothetical protein